MTCYRPLKCYRQAGDYDKDSGKWPISFKKSVRPHIVKDLPMYIPCGTCIGCRIDKSREWALRCYLESTQHSDNLFVTCTYDDEHLPDGCSLSIADHQKFLKRLRKQLGPFRFYMCGEYGSKTLRPHYHYLMFGLTVNDLTLYQQNGVNPTFTSEIVESIWGNGNVIVGYLSPASISYVCGYVNKKITNTKQGNPLGTVQKEFNLMSRRPAIGSAFYKSNKESIYEHGCIYMQDGKVNKIPRIYDKYLERDEPHKFKDIKLQRSVNSNIIDYKKLSKADKNYYKDLKHILTNLDNFDNMLNVMERKDEFVRHLQGIKHADFVTSERIQIAKLKFFDNGDI